MRDDPYVLRIEAQALREAADALYSPTHPPEGMNWSQRLLWNISLERQTHNVPVIKWLHERAQRREDRADFIEDARALDTFQRQWCKHESCIEQSFYWQCLLCGIKFTSNPHGN